MRGSILVIDHQTPTPDQDSGSASTVSYLKILTRAGLEVTLAPLDLAHGGRYTEALNALGIRTVSAPESSSIQAAIEAFAPRADVVLIFRAPVADQVFNLVRAAAPIARILLHTTDLHFLRMEREAVLTGSAPLADAARTMRAIELSLIARADASIVVSRHERDVLAELLPAAVVHRIPILRDTPPRPRELARWLGASPKGRHGVLFIGGYRHRPNVDAVHWFVREVWPLLQGSGFPHRLVIAGSHVPDDIVALASDTIEVPGFVADLAPLFAACRLSIAPLRYGAGIKGKIVTSLSHAVPVVATSIAAEGMGLRDGRDILIADAPAAFAERIAALCDNGWLWRRLSANGYRAFRNQFSLEAGEGAVLQVMEQLLALPRQP